MCGMCGVLSTQVLPPVVVNLFEQLLLINTLRGEYGAGVGMVPQRTSRSIKVVRTVNDPLDGQFQVDMRRAVAKKPVILFGHTRFPTTGSLELTHVHPFETGKIIGMHNGTMEHICGVKPEKTENDSQLLMSALAEKGPEETIRNSLGAYALVWLNTTQDTINFLRNKDRPLAFGTSEDMPDCLFWSSEALALEFILRRNTKTNPKIYLCPADTLICFSLRSKTLTPVYHGELSSLSVPKAPSVSNVLALPPPKTTSTAPVVCKPDENGKHEFWYKTFEEELVDEQKLKLILASGCTFCTRQASWYDFKNGQCHWVSREEFLCVKCHTADTETPLHDLNTMH